VLSENCSSNNCSVGVGCAWNVSLNSCEEIIIPPNVIYVDNSLAGDCLSGNYNILNRDCSGSNGDAYINPQDAADIVNPGDTVYFREGTYYNFDNLADAAVVMNVLRNGTTNNPIVFKNYYNEEVIFSARRLSDWGHFYAVTLGISSNMLQNASGKGVHDIIIDGLIFEDASKCGLMIFGPTNRYEMVENPTKNVLVKNVIARNNLGVMEGGGGIRTYGTVFNLTFEDCEFYNNTGTGILLSYISKTWNFGSIDSEMDGARNCTIKNCLSYNNNQPLFPGNTDGITAGFSYGCIFEDNVVFNNSDDGIDIYASVMNIMSNNIVFGHSYAGGNNAGIKYSAGGGGAHMVTGNVIFNNDGIGCEGSRPSMEYRTYYPSKLYANLVYNSGDNGFIFGEDLYHDNITGFDKEYFFNNIAVDNLPYDLIGGAVGYISSDYNFIGKAIDLASMRALGGDTHSLSGDPMFNNSELVINTNFGVDWTIDEKLDYIRSQVREKFSLQADSQAIDNGTIIEGYHCPTAGEVGDCVTWYGDAPDIGAYEYTEGELGSLSISSSEKTSSSTVSAIWNWLKGLLTGNTIKEITGRFIG